MAFLKHDRGVPVVTENQTLSARFNKHTLRVHLDGAPAVVKREPDDSKLGSSVMLADDLPQLCMFIRYLYAMHPQATNYFIHLSGSAPGAIHTYCFG